MLRRILAGLLGVILSGGVVFVVEAVGHLIYPIPEGVDPTDMQAVVASMPAGAMGMVLLAWVLGSFAGAIVSVLVGKSRGTGVVVVTIFLALCLFNLIVLPSPGWFWGATLVLVPLAGAAGIFLGSRGETPTRTDRTLNRAA